MMVRDSWMWPLLRFGFVFALPLAAFGQDGSSEETVRSFEIPVTLAGTVEIATGEPLPAAVPVNLVCSGQSDTGTSTAEVSGQGTAENDGLPSETRVLSSIDGDFIFHFYVIRVSSSHPHTSLQQVNLTGCTLTSQLPGFQSSTIYLGVRRPGESTYVGTILLRRLDDDGRRRTVNLTSLKAPDKAREEYGRAREEMRKEKPNYSKATKHLEKALKIYPEYANAWSQLGRAREATNDDSGAREAYERAISVDPEYLRPYLSLCRFELQANNWQKLAELSGFVLERNPTVVGAQYYQSLASFSLGDFETAEKWALAVRQNSETSRYPTTHFLLGAIWALKGNIPAAAEQFERYIELKPGTSMASQANLRLRQWKEQGLLRVH